ncbi:MAG: PIN domain-containing protein [bacterium]|nr:PIN domain-containing protein [bacterium]
MTAGIVDTTVIVHYFRKLPSAQAWVDSQSSLLSLFSITWLEVMHGAGSKAKEATSKAILDGFQLLYLIQSDQDWAMQQMERYRLSHGISINDCLIASVAFRLQVPLYTHNIKDMTPLLGSLAVKPYA